MTQARDLADGKFDTNTLVVDAANDRVGVGDASPPTALTLGSGTLTIKNASSDSNGLKILQDTSDTAKIINHYNGPMIFSTNNSERGRFLAGGGLTFNGDTAAANALDDYEEGQLSGLSVGEGTASFAYRTYVKVGRLVTLSLAIHTISDQTTNSAFVVSGLPFTANANNRAVGAVMHRYISDVGEDITAWVNSNSSEIKFYRSNQNANWGLLRHSDFNNSSAEIYLTVTYQTA